MRCTESSQEPICTNCVEVRGGIHREGGIDYTNSLRTSEKTSLIDKPHFSEVFRPLRCPMCMMISMAKNHHHIYEKKIFQLFFGAHKYTVVICSLTFFCC